MSDKKEIPGYLKTFSRQMRKNMTKEERHLWFDFFRSYPVRVKRQVIIGKYIVDFCCERAQVIIELDGGQHYEVEKKERCRTDPALRTIGILGPAVFKPGCDEKFFRGD